MTELFRIAVVGAGRIAEDSHIPAVLAWPEARLAAIVDPDAERRKRIADRFSIAPLLCKDVSEALGNVDAAIIATPNDTHHAIALACIRSGVHCLVEKPLAATLAEGEEIAAEAERRGVTVAVGYSSRFLDGVALMGDLIAARFFGDVHGFAYQFGSRGGWNPVSSYILERQAIGGGVAVVVGTHFIDWMLHWFGFPDEIAYGDDSLGGPEANALATFRYHRPAPLVGTMRLSKTVPLPPGFVMQTDRGTVSLEDKSHDAEIVLRPRESPDCEMIVRRPSAADGVGSSSPRGHFVRQLADFVRACRAGTAPRVSARQGVESLRLLDAMYAVRTSLPEFSPLLGVQEATA
jgi:predicted dehydrogenase